MIGAKEGVFLLSGILLLVNFWLARKVFFNVAVKSLHLLNAVLSDLDDEAKFALLKSKLFGTISALCLLFLAVAAVLFVSFIPVFIVNGISGLPWFTLDFDTSSTIALSIGSVIPFFLLPKNKSEYSEMSMLLHEIILDNYNLGKALLKYETKGVTAAPDDFVLVSGLARSGTTALTMALFNAGKFASINYANMPFLLAPKLWAKIYKPKDVSLKEREHKDKIKIGYNSIEALEEYFYKVQLNDGFIKTETLEEHDVSQDVYDSYLKYISLFADGKKTYLAKNNNLILRYQSLREKNKQFKAVFMFRNPVSHARSLLRQHELFSKRQQDDPFVKQYMEWLGHHEFGLSLKVFHFKNGEQFPLQPEDINFWLKVWINYYNRLLSLKGDNLFIYDYADFLKYPARFLKSVESNTHQKLDWNSVKAFDKKIEINNSGIHPELLEQAESIYHELKSCKVILEENVVG